MHVRALYDPWAISSQRPRIHPQRSRIQASGDIRIKPLRVLDAQYSAILWLQRPFSALISRSVVICRGLLLPFPRHDLPQPHNFYVHLSKRYPQAFSVGRLTQSFKDLVLPSPGMVRAEHSSPKEEIFLIPDSVIVSDAFQISTCSGLFCPSAWQGGSYYLSDWYRNRSSRKFNSLPKVTRQCCWGQT